MHPVTLWSYPCTETFENRVGIKIAYACANPKISKHVALITVFIEYLIYINMYLNERDIFFKKMKCSVLIRLSIFPDMRYSILFSHYRLPKSFSAAVISSLYLFLAWAWLAKAKGHSCHTKKPTLAKTFTEKNE